MAEQLESFEFKRGPKGDGGSRYDAFLDGGIYRLTVGEDIPSVATALAYLRRRAKTLDRKVHISSEGHALVVQAYTSNGASDA